MISLLIGFSFIGVVGVGSAIVLANYIDAVLSRRFDSFDERERKR